MSADHYTRANRCGIRHSKSQKLVYRLKRQRKGLFSPKHHRRCTCCCFVDSWHHECWKLISSDVIINLLIYVRFEKGWRGKFNKKCFTKPTKQKPQIRHENNWRERSLITLKNLFRAHEITSCRARVRDYFLSSWRLVVSLLAIIDPQLALPQIIRKKFVWFLREFELISVKIRFNDENLVLRSAILEQFCDKNLNLLVEGFFKIIFKIILKNQKFLKLKFSISSISI